MLQLPFSNTESLVRLAKSARGRFHGVYPDYQSAERAIPSAKLAGYDHAEIGKIYLNNMSKARDSDYPVLFWLERLLPQQSAVFDFGGNIGVSYYKFENYLQYPERMRWLVCDLPEITKAGCEEATQRSSSVEFTTDFEDANACEIFLALGVIQYVPDPLAQSLARLDRKPQSVLINRIPLWDGEDFVTLEDVYSAVCAYQVFNRAKFIQDICDLGYELADSWTTPDLALNVRWRPNHCIPAQSGLYFRLRP